MVSRLLKGIHNRGPPMPRYASTWGVDIVTKYIVFMGNNKEFSLLMALVEASRTSELRALDLRFRIYKPKLRRFIQASLTH